MKKKKLSPFYQLKKAIDTEVFDLALEVQAHMLAGEKMNTSYILGYRSALLFMQSTAQNIERDRFREFECIVAGADADNKLAAWADDITKEKGS